jgi:RHS repeat-associated protein
MSQNPRVTIKPHDQRVAKLIDGEITEKYLWENLTTLLAIYNPDDSLKKRFEYATQRMPMAMSMGREKYYLHYDQVGSLRAISDNSHHIIKEITYDSFGNILTDSNPTFTIPFGFAGGLYDTDTKLTRFGYRDYDAYVGKWTAKDPIGFGGGDSNLYGYVLGDGVNFVDPFGLWTFGITFNFGFGGGIGGTMGLNFVIDGHGNFQAQWIKGGGGYAGFGAGATMDFELSNADCVDMLKGHGYQYGADAKLGIDLEIGIFGATGYTGIYFGGGVGFNIPIPVPIGFGMFATHTTPLFGD